MAARPSARQAAQPNPGSRKKPLAVECVAVRKLPGFPGARFPLHRGHCALPGPGCRAGRFRHGAWRCPCARGPRSESHLSAGKRPGPKVWGGGVARASAKKYPAAQQHRSRRWIGQIPRRERLGRVHFASAGDDLDDRKLGGTGGLRRFFVTTNSLCTPRAGVFRRCRVRNRPQS